MSQKTTFRHTFSKQFTEVLNEFSKNHQHDDRKVFKNEWAAWSQRNDISCLINDEINSLTNSGFKGDVMDKMFKSTRYYFLKKVTNHKDDEKKERKQYVGISKLILEHMDLHIKEQFGNRPENAYNNYCNQFTQKIKSEIQELSNSTGDSIDDVYKKYKKTYKNRFYVMSRK
jgi:hypothetical protein